MCFSGMIPIAPVTLSYLVNAFPPGVETEAHREIIRRQQHTHLAPIEINTLLTGISLLLVVSLPGEKMHNKKKEYIGKERQLGGTTVGPEYLVVSV